MSGNRPERVGDQVREEVAEMLLKGELKDPRIGFVTITKVKMSPDLKNAKIFFSVIGTKEDVQKSLEGLKSAAPYVRRELARRIKLRQIPNVTFGYDDSLAYAERIETVLREAKKGPTGDGSESKG